MSAPKIRKLDEVVVNRIAAGEVIQRPSNALKELIENSLDAKATNIQITIKEGGLKLLQIQDNGTGIRKEDLGIVCERFTTSKLQEFDDLKSIATFGFRGEALASISHVALLTITTKTAEDRCAYKASYVDSKLKGSPAPCAGNQGTIITVENLFYNVATRRKVVSNAFEEFAKIAEVVTKYAIHNPKVGFTLKKQGEIKTQVRTQHSSTKQNNIRTLYSDEVYRELMEVSLENEQYQFKFHALITNPSYSNKKMSFLLFINHRLVDSTTIKKMLDDLYSTYLPKKAHPWCYLSLEINPENVDVNVHPTKHEVRFLHEGLIIEKIRNALEEKLTGSNTSRTFYVQNRLPAVDMTADALKEVLPEYDDKNRSDKTKKVYQHEMVRTDSNEQKLDKFNFTIQSSPKESKSKDESSKLSKNLREKNNVLETFAKVIDVEMPDASTSHKKVEQPKTPMKENSRASANNNQPVSECSQPSDTLTRDLQSYCVNNFRREVKLSSVLELRKEVEDNFHQGLREIVTNLTFVGCVNETFALVQSGIYLYICNTQTLAHELFYEIMLYNFANHGIIKFSEPLVLYDLAKLGLETEEASWTEEDGSKHELAENVRDLLLEKADMLREYFSIVIDKHGNLKALPILIENYFPAGSEIPLFILRLATEVNWAHEKLCFKDVCKETARLYSRLDPNAKSSNWKHVTEHIIYNAIKGSLLPPKQFSHDSTFLKLTSLSELYKVFERC